MTRTNEVSATTPPPAPPCVHDAQRRDGTFDDHCLLCGAVGYWHEGHRHDERHPSGKVLWRWACAGCATVDAATGPQGGAE